MVHDKAICAVVAVFVTIPSAAMAAKAATPVFSPITGTYNTRQSVAISDATPGAKIYFTTNGTTPTASSTLYTAPVTINATTTLKAIATAAGFTSSAVASATYTLKAGTPTMSPPPGTYVGARAVTLTDVTTGAVLYYTTNGTTPTTSSTKYAGPFTVSSTKTVKALATATGYSNSAIATGAYTIVASTATPSFSIAGGVYTSPQSVSMADATPNAQIFYTSDGTTPTTASTRFSSPISVQRTTTLKAIATAAGLASSQVASATYTITPVLTAIAATSPSRRIAPGSAIQCSAVGAYSDGSSRELTALASWNSSSPGVATVSAGGVLTAWAPGTTMVAASWGAVSAEFLVSVVSVVNGNTVHYCYDGAGNVTSRMACAPGQSCAVPCP